MLSPLPLRPELDPPLNSPGALISSPLGSGWPLTSPRLGRSPGAYVVQEGRLSLEMFAFADGEEGRAGPHPSLELSATLDGGANAGGGALHRAASLQLELYAPPNQQPKPLPASLAGATAAQLDAKASHAAQLLRELPGALEKEMQRTVSAAKASLGLHAYDSSRLEGHLRAVLQEENAAVPSSAPGAAPPSTQPARPGRGDAPGFAAGLPPPPQPRAPKRSLPQDGAAAARPAKRRIDLIKDLEAQLLHMYQLTRSLEHTAEQAEAKRAAAVQENDALWALAAHVHAALSAAVAERRQAAAAAQAQLAEAAALPSTLPPPPPVAPQQQQQQQPLVPTQLGQVPQQAALPRMTPCHQGGLAALFSPDGDDLFAACNMFVSPWDRAPGQQERDKPRKLFGEDLPSLPAPAPQR